MALDTNDIATVREWAREVVTNHEYEMMNNGISSPLDGILREWVKRELKSFVEDYDNSCSYGQLVHDTGRALIRDYMRTPEFAEKVKEIVGVGVEPAMTTEATSATVSLPETAEQDRPPQIVQERPVGTIATGSQMPPVPRSNVAVMVRLTYLGSRHNHNETLSSANTVTLGDEHGWTVEWTDQPGVVRVTGLPSEWLQRLARDGSFSHELRTGDRYYVRVEARV